MSVDGVAHDSFFFFQDLFIYLLRLRWVLVVAHLIFVAACELLVVACMRDLVSRPGIKPGPPALGAWSLTRWTTREVPIAHRSFLFIYLFVCLFVCLFVYFWLCWVFVSVRELSLVAASGGHSSSRCTGLSLSRPLLLRSTGSRRAGSAVVARGLSCPVACGIFPDQGSNPCPLHWQADSQPLCHQGSP